MRVSFARDRMSYCAPTLTRAEDRPRAVRHSMHENAPHAHECTSTGNNVYANTYTRGSIHVPYVALAPVCIYMYTRRQSGQTSNISRQRVVKYSMRLHVKKYLGIEVAAAAH